MSHHVNQKNKSGHFYNNLLRVAVIFGLFGAWALAVYGRQQLMHLTCSLAQQACSETNIFAFERFATRFNSVEADHLSFLGQYFVGIVALFVPCAIAVWKVTRQATYTVKIALRELGSDLLFLFQVVALNGLINELARLIVQRPRPFVYLEPLRLGTNPAHYTSFYSGHTSFSATLTVATILVLINRKIPANISWLTGIGLSFATVLVAYGRIFSGRHFPTDVLAAIAVGVFVAVVSNRFWKRANLATRSSS